GVGAAARQADGEAGDATRKGERLHVRSSVLVPKTGSARGRVANDSAPSPPGTTRSTRASPSGTAPLRWGRRNGAPAQPRGRGPPEVRKKRPRVTRSPGSRYGVSSAMWTRRPRPKLQLLPEASA